MTKQEIGAKMGTENLIPMNQRTLEERRQIGRMGGVKVSKKKSLSSRINGLLNNKSLTDEQRYILARLRDKDYLEVLNELISMNLELSSDIDIRNKTIEQLQKMLPNRNLNLNLEPGKSDSVELSEFLSRIGLNNKVSEEDIGSLSSKEQQEVIETWEKSLIDDD